MRAPRHCTANGFRRCCILILHFVVAAVYMDPDYFDLDGPSISAVDVAEAGADAEWVLTNDGGAGGQADYFVDDAAANDFDLEGGADGQADVHDLDSGSQIVAAYPDVNSFEHDLSGICADDFGLHDVIDAGSWTGENACCTHSSTARHCATLTGMGQGISKAEVEQSRGRGQKRYDSSL